MSGDHAALMDQVYRRQRHIYDATRKFFLFGRDRLIEGLDCRPGMRVLEIGCGTGRNLALIGRRWPGAVLHGLDISQEMLAQARARLGESARLAQGDAAAFDAAALFDVPRFDRIVMSYTLSMIPPWERAVAQACAALAPGGELHVVDFGSLSGMPPLPRTILHSWLDRFHVAPRTELAHVMDGAARTGGRTCSVRAGPFAYYVLGRIA